MPHNCRALIICCIDFRFHSAIRDFLVSLGLKDQYDLVSLAGVSKGLVEKDPVSTELILKQIEISQRLHKIREVYLMHHLDCGAYGSRQAFKSDQEERDKQLTDLESSRRIISEKFSEVEVKKVLVRLDEQNNIDFEVIN